MSDLDDALERFQNRGFEYAGGLANHGDAPWYVVDKDLENNLLLIGSPDTVARKIKAAAEEGFFNTMFCELDFGELAEDDLMRSIRLLGEEVMPQLRGYDPT